MSWTPIEQTKEDLKPLVMRPSDASIVEVSDVPLSEREPDRQGRHTSAGPIAFIPVPEKYKYRGWTLSEKILAFYSSLLDAFGADNLFKFQSAKGLLYHRHPRAAAIYLSVLWAHGYLEKYVAGEYDRGLQSGGKTGKYHGVWYKIIRRVI